MGMFFPSDGDTVTKELFYEGMLRVLKEICSSFGKRAKPSDNKKSTGGLNEAAGWLLLYMG